MLRRAAGAACGRALRERTEGVAAVVVACDPAEDGRGGTDAIQRAEDEEALEWSGDHTRRATKHPRGMPRVTLGDNLVAGKTVQLVAQAVAYKE